MDDSKIVERDDASTQQHFSNIAKIKGGKRQEYRGIQESETILSKESHLVGRVGASEKSLGNEFEFEGTS